LKRSIRPALLSWPEGIEWSVIRLDQKLWRLVGIEALPHAADETHNREKQNSNYFDIGVEAHTGEGGQTMHRRNSTRNGIAKLPSG